MNDNQPKIQSTTEIGNILLNHVGKIVRVSDDYAQFTVYGKLSVAHYNRDHFTATLADDSKLHYAAASFFAEDVWFVNASSDDMLCIVLTHSE